MVDQTIGGFRIPLAGDARAVSASPKPLIERERGLAPFTLSPLFRPATLSVVFYRAKEEPANG